MQTPRVWFTSDQHFGHKNVINLSNRPFQSIEEMNEEIVARWNSLVSEDDSVYCLGDFSLSRDAMVNHVKRLNGRKVLIAGNHDHCHPVHAKKPEKVSRMTKFYLDSGFSEVRLFGYVVFDSPILLSHIPYSGDHVYEGREYLDKYRPRDDGLWLLHGHVHGEWKVRGRQINVGVDVWDYYPVSKEQIVSLINGDTIK